MTTAFYKLLTAQERLQAAEETLKTAQTTQDAAEARLSNGRATLPDVLNARAETSQAVFDRESADGDQRIARVELTDGLSFAQLVNESASRLPADATVIAVLGDVPPEVAWTLGNLRRRGYAVTAVLVMFDEYESSECLGRLIGAGVDARLVTSEESLSALCQQQLVR